MVDTDMEDSSRTVVAAENGPPWWAPLWEFFIHISVGTLLFVFIAIPAVGLDSFISVLHHSEVSEPIVLGMTGCKYLLFSTDIFLFAIFIFRQAFKGVRRLW